MGIDKNDLFNEIIKIGTANRSKKDQIVDGITSAIELRMLEVGDKLPSVNEMIKALGFARQTIVNSYQELIERGIVESTNRLGYFIAQDEVRQKLKVCLVLYAFDTFQETFYECFRKSLGPGIQVDVFFHHNNYRVFQNTIQDVKSKYGMYVIAPIAGPNTRELLEELPSQKTLIVDRYVELDASYSYIAQEFRKSSYEAFSALADEIKKFDEFVFFFKYNSAEPSEVLDSFRQFVSDYNIKGVIRGEYEKDSIEPNKVYFTIHNLELWEMLKDIKVKNLKLGKELGILSHNDDSVKEIIFNGITTFSIDFAEMGRLAAAYVLDRKPIQHIMPSKLFKRNSL
ncbi:GntR family transcriptional regulator [Sphingobacterium olei]|uniref:GntR family transcriptional regulator n=1 Tax=Sphingobacterium olei TaxID=2571155 RepID=A0A4U0NYR6_9SPHI|nr:GntR family transcriptional regulator [Sphingobacterium olei]TJZ59965.1 GntR family transcriptional regulator [Sphingobacterium olei]